MILLYVSNLGTAVYGVDGLPYSDKRLVEAWWATAKTANLYTMYT